MPRQHVHGARIKERAKRPSQESAATMTRTIIKSLHISQSVRGILEKTHLDTRNYSTDNQEYQGNITINFWGLTAFCL
jgi:hypothetical protein